MKWLNSDVRWSYGSDQNGLNVIKKREKKTRLLNTLTLIKYRELNNPAFFLFFSTVTELFLR